MVFWRFAVRNLQFGTGTLRSHRRIGRESSAAKRPAIAAAGVYQRKYVGLIVAFIFVNVFQLQIDDGLLARRAGDAADLFRDA